MLLLIAVANVPFWTLLWDQPAPSGLDTAWTLLRGALVDHRSYPLFSMLFGFGVATMTSRRVASAVRQAEAALPPGSDPQLRESHLAQARQEATVAARRLVRRRGLWMLLFGAVHGTLFFGDVIGAYGLVAVVLAGVVAHRRYRAMAWLAGISTLAVLATTFATGWQAAVNGVPFAPGSSISHLDESFLAVLLSPAYPVVSLSTWVLITVMYVLSSMTLPAVLLGVRLADTDLLSHPDRRHRALVRGGLGALAVGALGALPARLDLLGLAVPAWLNAVTYCVEMLAGLLGACGWLALLAAWAGPGTGEPLRGARWMLAAVGKRSMSAYVGQTLLFLMIFGGLGAAGLPGGGELVNGLVAVAVWAVLAGLCALAERAGYSRGPLEVLLRTAVARSARRRPSQALGS